MKRRPTRRGSPTTADVVIEALGDQGDGLARAAGRRLVVPGALPGERHHVRIEPGAAEPLVAA
ncbi:MAG: TRAM domain-containing protein, partial [Pseudomonadota bacterium]